MRSLSCIDNKKTAKLLRDALRKSGMNQLAIANSVGINQSQVSRLLNGDFVRASKSMYALCKTLNVNPVALNNSLSLKEYPQLVMHLSDFLDGSRKRELALIKLIRATRSLMR